MKMLLKICDTGSKVWLTVPNTGDDVIEVTATFIRSDKDQFFSFGKRPTKLTVITSAKPESESAQDHLSATDCNPTT